MSEDITLRDKLAMSMDTESIPIIKNEETLKYIGEKFGLEWSSQDTVEQIKFALEYQAIIRYMYADAMLKLRG